MGWSSAQAATIAVSTLNDSGPGSLRQAVLDANGQAGADSITFASGLTGSVVLTSGEIVINSDLVIEGTATNPLTLSGGGTQRLFNITSGQVGLRNLTLSDGYVMGNAGVDRSAEKGGDSGGGAILNAGVLTLSNVTLSNNKAVAGKGGSGHLLRNFGTADQLRGGLGGNARGGAILNAGTLTLIQTHLQGNTAVGGQGGTGGTLFDTQTLRPTRYGDGGRGGDAFGGAIYNGGIVKIDGTSPSGPTSSPNQAIGGLGGTQGRGNSRAESGTGYSDDIRDVPPVAKPLTISSSQDQPISVQLPGMGDTLTYAIASGTLPNGIKLDAAKGIISGSSSVSGNGLTVSYTVTDGYRTSAPAIITFNFTASDPKSLVVNSLSDVMDNADGKNTLREAVAYANALNNPTAPSTITFAGGLQGTIVLTNGALKITGNMSVVGPRDRAIVVDGNLQDRVFYILSGTTSISNLSITRGVEGGIVNGVSSHLELANCTVFNNVSKTNGPAVTGRGGGLYNAGTASVRNCTFAVNVDVMNNGGGIYNSGSLTIESSTIARNSSWIKGAGIYSIGTLTLNNTIVAENNVLTDPEAAQGVDLYGDTQLADYNLIEDIAGGYVRGEHNILGKEALLGALENNGGPTSTFSLRTGSPALDAGQTDLTTDQRGLPRPARQGVDIGAFELQDIPFGITSLTLLPTGPKTKTVMVARVVINNVTKKTSYNYVWRKNGQVVRTSTNSKSNQSRLDLNVAGNGDKGDLITLDVTVKDSPTSPISVSKSASVTVLNSIPVLNEVKLNLLTPTATQTVKAILQGGDADSTDTLTPLCKWRLNGTVLMAEKGTWVDLSKYPKVKAGDVLSLEARLTDGEAFSKTVRAQATVKGATAPAANAPIYAPLPGSSGNAS